MTNDEQRIAIAEACGWGGCYAAHGMLLGDPQPGKGIGVEQLPQYTHDLNAMHQAEKVLTQGGKTQYVFHLQTICGGQQFGDNYFATAAQRAKAFLLVVGRWRGGEATLRPNNEVSQRRGQHD